jgi:MFS family permease
MMENRPGSRENDAPFAACWAYGAARLRRLFRALQGRNYRLYFGGLSLAAIGMWMHQLALSWLVYRVTHSTLMLGVVSGAGQLPVFLLAPFAGVVVDRWDRQRLLLVTQTLIMLQAVGLAWLVLAEAATLERLLLCSVFLGLVHAVDIPARQAIIVNLVDQPEDLSNAIALNSSMINGARLIGPSLAGLVIAVVGEGLCFLLNGLSHLALLAALRAMRLPPHPNAAPRTPVLAEAYAGVRYAWSYPPIRAILLLVGLVSLCGLPYQVLMPVFATQSLHGDVHTLGLLTAASGVGAILGALYVAARDSVLGLERMLALSMGLFGLGLVGFSFTQQVGVAALALVVASGSMMMLTVASNTVLQTLVEDDKRGRIMSLYTMAFMGMAPVGSVLAGSVATQLGAPQTVRLGGVCCLVGTLLFARYLPTLQVIVQPTYANQRLVQAATLRLQTAIDAWLHVYH